MVRIRIRRPDPRLSLTKSMPHCLSGPQVLALAYGKNLVVDRLDDLHVPKGMIDLAYTETVVEIPSGCVAYTVTFDAASGSELAKMYTDFFSVPVN